MMINDDRCHAKKVSTTATISISTVTVQRSTERFRNRSQLIVIQLNFIQPSTIFVVALCKTTWRRFTSTRVKPTQSAMGVIVANCDSNPCFCSRWTLLADLSHKGLKQRGAPTHLTLFFLSQLSALDLGWNWALYSTLTLLFLQRACLCFCSMTCFCRSSANSMFSRHKSQRAIAKPKMDGRGAKESFEPIFLLQFRRQRGVKGGCYRKQL